MNSSQYFRLPQAWRQHQLTRLGFHFLFVAAFAMFGGALRGFNLLLVLAALSVGALFVQWRWSRRSIDAVSIGRRLPSEAFAGSTFRVGYRLHNANRFLPLWMIRVEDTMLSLHDGTIANPVCGVGVISPRQSVPTHFDCVAENRGRYRLGPLRIATSFPLSLFVARQSIEATEDFHVYPRLIQLRAGWKRQILSRSGGITATARRSGQSDGEFFGLRKWQSGDSPRWIHWRTTARLDEPAVRQFEQQRRYDVVILVDGFQDPFNRDKLAVENAISLAATLVIHLVGAPSNRVLLAVAARTSDAVIGSSVGKRLMLEMLAGLHPTKAPMLADALARARQVVGTAKDLVVVSPRSLAEAISASETRSKEEKQSSEENLEPWLQPWIRRGAFRWIDVRESSVQRWAAMPTTESLARKDSIDNRSAISSASIHRTVDDRQSRDEAIHGE